ncbi:hypothetical protein KC845_01020 [Candidatus Kaiserbacteria bacterium]|nr:hypothetical protein [Candidatus Kaiserbacteria bacterium]
MTTRKVLTPDHDTAPLTLWHYQVKITNIESKRTLFNWINFVDILCGQAELIGYDPESRSATVLVSGYYRNGCRKGIVTATSLSNKKLKAKVLKEYSAIA